MTVWRSIQSQGKRPYMEDRYVIRLKFYRNYDLIAIFDGHGGRFVADYCADNLPRILNEKIVLSNGNLRQALTAAFEEVDARMPFEQSYMTGSTALIVLFNGRDLWVANTGDSRAIMNKAHTYAILSRDHKPNATDERARIESNGGFVENVGGFGVWRVQGQLALSRAIGDKHYRPMVIPTPEVRHIRFDPALNRFFVIATDGLWDVVSNVQANSIATNATGPKDACTKLMSAAMRNGMEDNTTIIVGFVE